MAYHFKLSEAPAVAVRRVCCECIGEALKRLEKPNHPAAIHTARKEIKKLRAIFNLVRQEIGRGAHRKNNATLREAATHLAVPRDARVMFKAFEKLSGQPAKQFGDMAAKLKRHSQREARQFRKSDLVARAKKLLRKTNRRIGRLKIKATGWTVLEPGWKEGYELGRKACDLARRDPDPEHLHEWRKRVKQLWYYFRLLGPGRHTVMEDLQSLGELLGDEHDLFLLQQFVAVHGRGLSWEETALNRLIATRRKELRLAALKLGSRLYTGANEIEYPRLKK